MTDTQDRELTNDAPVGSTIETGPLGTATIPASRYTSRAWADLEAERLWPHSWQIAAARGQVAEPGDWCEYRCGPISVLVVRGDDLVAVAESSAKGGKLLRVIGGLG